MKRSELWERLKAAGITQSKRTDCPPDNDLKIVVCHSQVSGKALIDFLCSLDEKKLAHSVKKPTISDGDGPLLEQE